MLIDNSRRAKPIECWALAAVFLALIAHSLLKVGPTDVPWHLATAEHAFHHGGFIFGWPITNTFSYTFPDFPLYQQYPVFQAALFSVYQATGFAGLSLFGCAMWLMTFYVLICWAGGFRANAPRHLLWFFVLLCLQRRMILRPDILSTLLLLIIVFCLEEYRCGRGRRGALVLIVLMQWALVNSHQLFPAGLLFQAAMLFHLVLARAGHRRLGLAEADVKVPILPLTAAVLLSFLVCGISPLGFEIFSVPFVTADSLVSHRRHVTEFAYIWHDPYEFALFLGAAILGAGALLRDWRRRAGSFFQLGIWLVALGMCLAASRGLALFGAMSGALLARSLVQFPTSAGLSGGSGRLGARRLASLSVVFAGVIFIVYFRWLHPVRGLDGLQPGIGKSLGQWPDATVRFLRTQMPPGRMLNLSWYSGNALIWELSPMKGIFVDPRFEAYPREFLLRTIAAQSDQAVLDELIAEYQPEWFVGEMRLQSVVDRGAELVRRGWRLVFADAVLFVLIKSDDQTHEYLRRDYFAKNPVEIKGLLEEEPDLLAQQLPRVDYFRQAMGIAPAAESTTG